MVKLQLLALLRDPQVSLSRPTPGGLRSSGATLDLMQRENLDRVKWRGRWANDNVLKHYLQLGVYHLASLNFSIESRRLIDRYCLVYDEFLFAILAEE